MGPPDVYLAVNLKKRIERVVWVSYPTSHMSDRESQEED